MVALVAGAFGVSNASAGTPPTVSAVIVNPLESPVPVSVSNPVRIANVEGTTLKVDTAPVKIDPAQNTVKVGEPIYVRESRQPLNLKDDLTGSPHYQMTDPETGWMYLVPNGKYLVIANITGVLDLTSAVAAESATLSLADGNWPMTRVGSRGFAVSEDCEIYVDEGDLIPASISWEPGGLFDDGYIALSGYLADKP